MANKFLFYVQWFFNNWIFPVFRVRICIKMAPRIQIRIQIREADSGSGSSSYQMAKKLNVFCLFSLTYFVGLQQVWVLYQFLGIIALITKGAKNHEILWNFKFIFILEQKDLGSGSGSALWYKPWIRIQIRIKAYAGPKHRFFPGFKSGNVTGNLGLRIREFSFFEVLTEIISNNRKKFAHHICKKKKKIIAP